MSITFRYKSAKRPDGTLVKIPSIPITLTGKESLDTVALIDSGADISVIPKVIAEVIGLKFNDESVFAYGIGGKIKATQSTAAISISKGHENYKFNIPVKIVLDTYEFPVLLGRLGFFDRFIIIFDQQEERIVLKSKQKEIF